MTNWAHGSDNSVFGFSHFWSLAVEEQFYLLWPLLVYRLAPRRLFSVCIAIAAGSLVARSALAFAGVDAQFIYTSTLCRIDALALGAAGAALMRDEGLRTAAARLLRPVSIAALLLFGLGVVSTHAYDLESLACQTYGYTILALACAVLVVGTALVDSGSANRLTTFLRIAPLRSCGKYSYSMYVLHGIAHKLIGEPWLTSVYGDRIPPQIVLTYGLAMILLSYVGALVTYHALEKHCLRLKDRLQPRRTLAPSVQTGAPAG
jgi:peptidoglycan/LPS O-acetylase OafA/YrhL